MALLGLYVRQDCIVRIRYRRGGDTKGILGAACVVLMRR